MRQMSTTGTRQVVTQDLEENISIRLVVNGTEQTIATAGVDIFDPAGGAITSGSATTISGSVATFQATWSESTYAIEDGYIARWNLEWSQDAVTYNKIIKSYFDVVRRRWENQVTDTDLTGLHPYLVLPTGLTSYKSFREVAWRRITRTIRSRFNLYPGNIFYPEDMFDVVIAFSLSAYYMGNSFDAQGSEDWEKSQYYERQGNEMLESVMSNLAIDINEDGYLAENEKNFFLGGVQLVR
jgi:hypothetical protein